MRHFILPLLLSIFTLTVHADPRHPSSPSVPRSAFHQRKSLAFRKKSPSTPGLAPLAIHGRDGPLDISLGDGNGNDLNIPGGLPSLLNGGGSGPDSSAPTSDSSTSASATSSSTSSTDSSAASSSPVSTADSTSATSTPAPAPSSAADTGSAPATSTTSSCAPGLLQNLIGGCDSEPTTTTTTTPTDPASTPNPTSATPSSDSPSAPPSTPTTTPCAQGLIANLVGGCDPPPSTTANDGPTSAPVDTSSASPTDTGSNPPPTQTQTQTPSDPTTTTPSDPTTTTPNDPTTTTPTCANGLVANLLGGCEPPSTTPASTPAAGTTSPASSPSSPPDTTASAPAPTSSCGAGLIGNLLGGCEPAPTTTEASSPPPTTTAPAPSGSSGINSAPSPATTTTKCAPGLIANLLGGCEPEPSSTNSGTGTRTGTRTGTGVSTVTGTGSVAPTSSATTTPCGALGDLLGCEPTSTSPASATAPATAPASGSATGAPTTTAAPSGPISKSKSGSAAPTSTTDCGPLGLGCLSSAPVSASASASATASATSAVVSQSDQPSCGILGLLPCPSSSVRSSQSITGSSASATITSAPSSPSSVSVSASASASASASKSSTCDGLGSLLGLCSQSSASQTQSVTITFPSSAPSSAPSSTLTSSVTRSTTVSVSLDSQFTFLTQTSLLLNAPTSTSTGSVTQTDPDAPATALSDLSSSVPSATASAAPVLPSTLAARVYPPTQISANEDLSNYTLCALLFDNQLPWTFVSGSADSEAQLFSWTPALLSAALGLSPADIKTFALQVYIPQGYKTPEDVNMLLTTFLVYIPKAYVSNLAAQLKVRSSAFYTILGDPYASVAAHVDPSFLITSVSASQIPGGGTVSGASSGSSKRTDVIIGVVSALGGVTLIVLGVLAYRSIKQRRELAHRRLAEEQEATAAYPDRTGRDFDQDSVGGQRRRSFYFAEDSLRGVGSVMSAGGFQAGAGPSSPAHMNMMQQHQPGGIVEFSYLDHQPDHDGIQEMRRAGPISAPVLQQSSMNW